MENSPSEYFNIGRGRQTGVGEAVTPNYKRLAEVKDTSLQRRALDIKERALEAAPFACATASGISLGP